MALTSSTYQPPAVIGEDVAPISKLFVRVGIERTFALRSSPGLNMVFSYLRPTAEALRTFSFKLREYPLPRVIQLRWAEVAGVGDSRVRAGARGDAVQVPAGSPGDETETVVTGQFMTPTDDA